MRADRIIVVDNHQILETGTHTELLAANGPYAHMYATWSSHSA
jgi:ATP-binding cassette, subfamily B, bacterial